MPDWTKLAKIAAFGLIGWQTGISDSVITAGADVLFGRDGPPDLKKLAQQAGRALEEAMAVEAPGISLDAVAAELEAVLTGHAPTLRTIVDHHAMREEAVAIAILDAGRAHFDPAHRNLLQNALTGIYRTWLGDRQTLDQLLPEALRALLAMRDAIAALPEETATALLELQTRLLLTDGRRLMTGDAGQPSWLLRPDYAVVPFHPAREADLQALLDWCGDEKTRAVRLIHGPGGLGKTRLAMELVRRLRDQGWRAGFLDRAADDPPPDSFRRLCDDQRPVCVVVDYAETRKNALVRLLRRTRTGRAPKLRLLLLARAEAEWWQTLGHADADVQELMGSHSSTIGLVPIEATDGHRTEIFTSARRIFAQRLGLAEAATAPPDLSPDRYGIPLYIHIAALAAAAGEAVPATDDLLDWTLRRERRAWEEALGSVGLPPERERRLLVEAILYGTLVDGFVDPATALAALPLARGKTAIELDLLARLIARLYPDSRTAGALRPDLLGEQLVARELGNHPAILPLVFAPGQPERHTAAATVLTRLALRSPAGTPLLDSAIAAHAETAGRAFIEVGRALDPLPVICLQTHLERITADPARRRLATALIPFPYPSLACAPLAANVCGILARPDGAEGDEARLAERAGHANNHGVWLDALGRREEALDATEEATGLYRRLAEARPDAFLPDLAMSLNNLGNRLDALGRREEALDATEEAVAIRRRLAEARPDAFLPDLARSLNNLGVRLNALGRPEDALDATEEAVAIRRRLAEARPDAFLPDLAASLSNLGVRLNALGRPEDALDATEEAVGLYRRLAEARPDAFLPDLAASLDNLGNRLDALGRREDALDATEEAIAIRRRLAEARPDAFLPDLARSLNNLGNRLDALGRREDALDATEEAVAIRRRLAEARPDAFLPDLARSLNNLGIRLDALGRREDALAATEEAVDLYRRLAEARPDAFLPDLAASLNNLGTMLDALGRREEALAATEEAVGLYRRLAEARPDAFLPDLAMSLNNLGAMLDALGRREEALDATEEAVAIRRSLAEHRPDAFLPDLAVSLFNLSLRLNTLERLDEALASNVEAIEALRPTFLRLPRAVAHWMRPMHRQYVERCAKLGVEPDAALLGPIAEVLRELDEAD